MLRRPGYTTMLTCSPAGILAFFFDHLHGGIETAEFVHQVARLGLRPEPHAALGDRLDFRERTVAGGGDLAHEIVVALVDALFQDLPLFRSERRVVGIDAGVLAALDRILGDRPACRRGRGDSACRRPRRWSRSRSAGRRQSGRRSSPCSIRRMPRGRTWRSPAASSGRAASSDAGFRRTRSLRRPGESMRTITALIEESLATCFSSLLKPYDVRLVSSCPLSLSSPRTMSPAPMTRAIRLLPRRPASSGGTFRYFSKETLFGSPEFRRVFSSPHIWSSKRSSSTSPALQRLGCRERPLVDDRPHFLGRLLPRRRDPADQVAVQIVHDAGDHLAGLGTHVGAGEHVAEILVLSGVLDLHAHAQLVQRVLEIHHLGAHALEHERLLRPEVDAVGAQCDVVFARARAAAERRRRVCRTCGTARRPSGSLRASPIPLRCLPARRMTALMFGSTAAFLRLIQMPATVSAGSCRRESRAVRPAAFREFRRSAASAARSCRRSAAASRESGEARQRAE